MNLVNVQLPSQPWLQQDGENLTILAANLSTAIKKDPELFHEHNWVNKVKKEIESYQFSFSSSQIKALTEFLCAFSNNPLLIVASLSALYEMGKTISLVP